MCPHLSSQNLGQPAGMINVLLAGIHSVPNIVGMRLLHDLEVSSAVQCHQM